MLTAQLSKVALAEVEERRRHPQQARKRLGDAAAGEPQDALAVAQPPQQMAPRKIFWRLPMRPLPSLRSGA